MAADTAHSIGEYLDRQPLANAYLRALLACVSPTFPVKWLTRTSAGEIVAVAAWTDGWLPGLPFAWCCIAAGDPLERETAAAFAEELVREARGDWVLTGPRTSTLPIAAEVQPGVASHSFSFEARSRQTALPEARPGVRRVSEADLPRLLAFYSQWGGGVDAQTQLRRWAMVARRAWIADVDGEILAAAMTHIEGADTALVGGVFTAPKHRGKGWATAVSAALCRDLESDGITTGLYYEAQNAAAKRVYRGLGFAPVTEWYNALMPHKP